MDLALNNLQRLICHKTKQTKPITLSSCIHTEMINLRFEAWALPLNPIVCRKASRVYCYRTTFSTSAINRYLMEDPSKNQRMPTLAPSCKPYCQRRLWSATYPWLDSPFWLDWLPKSDCVVLISRGLHRVTHLLDQSTPTHCHPPVY